MSNLNKILNMRITLLWQEHHSPIINHVLMSHLAGNIKQQKRRTKITKAMRL